MENSPKKGCIHPKKSIYPVLVYKPYITDVLHWKYTYMKLRETENSRYFKNIYYKLHNTQTARTCRWGKRKTHVTSTHLLYITEHTKYTYMYMRDTENSPYFPSFIVHYRTHKIHVHVWKRKTYTELENMWVKPEALCCYVRVFFLLFFQRGSPLTLKAVVIRPSAFYLLAHTLLNVLRYSIFNR